MDFSQDIADLGFEAVLKYREISGIDNDNELPEVFLGSQIAISLHERLDVSAQIERRYDKIIHELGASICTGILEKQDKKRSDIALYRDKKPIAIVEIKICDERDLNGKKVSEDLEKMKAMSEAIPIDIYLAFLLTDTEQTIFAERRLTLEEKLGARLSGESKRVRSRDGKWEWQFLAGKF